MRRMRRLIALALLCLSGFGSITSTLFAETGWQLPACCRKSGKHHCAMQMPTEVGGISQRSQLQALAPKCGCPIPESTAALYAHAGTLSAARVYYGLVLSHPAVPTQTEALRRISFTRSGQKRGPPTLS